MSRSFCLPFFLSIPLHVLSQNQTQPNGYHLVQGTVIDSVSDSPIPQVNIWTTHSGAVSDAGGNFSLLVLAGDTLHFSHISYNDLVVRPDKKITQSRIRVTLYQKIRLLAEVKIYSYLSESAFRQKIIETTPTLSKEEESAKINSRIISYLAKYAPAYPMNANDNYLDYIKGPQGVIIFSSKPSKGLIRAIKCHKAKSAFVQKISRFG